MDNSSPIPMPLQGVVGGWGGGLGMRLNWQLFCTWFWCMILIQVSSCWDCYYHSLCLPPIIHKVNHDLVDSQHELQVWVSPTLYMCAYMCPCKYVYKYKHVLCVCVCVYAYVMCMCLNVRVDMCTYIQCMCCVGVCMCPSCACTCLNVRACHVYLHVYLPVWVNMSPHMCVCMCVCTCQKAGRGLGMKLGGMAQDCWI